MIDAESPEALAWAELQRRGSIRSRYLRDIEVEVASELARCLDPFVHEQDIRPYGRSLADGRHSLVLVVKGQPSRLLLLHERMDTDQDYASHAVWVDGVLRPTRASEQAVPATKGTRHTAAARHTYDCPDTLAFVVSTDGPVTVFSDGRRIAELKVAGYRKAEDTIERLAGERRAERGKTF